MDEPASGEDVIQAKPQPPTFEFPPIGWKDVACIGPLVVSGLWRFVGFGWVQANLIAHSALLLSAIRGTIASIIAAAAVSHSGAFPIWVVILVPIPILMFDDPFIYWAGMRYGRPLLNYLTANNPSLERMLPRCERLFERHSSLAIIIANFPLNPLPMATIVYFLAGETRMRFARFVATDILSLIIFVSPYAALGWWLGDRATGVANTIGKYALIISIPFILFIVYVTVRSYRQSMRQMREKYGDDWMERMK